MTLIIHRPAKPAADGKPQHNSKQPTLKAHVYGSCIKSAALDVAGQFSEKQPNCRTARIATILATDRAGKMIPDGQGGWKTRQVIVRTGPLFEVRLETTRELTCDDLKVGRDGKPRQPTSQILVAKNRNNLTVERQWLALRPVIDKLGNLEAILDELDGKINFELLMRVIPTVIE